MYEYMRGLQQQFFKEPDFPELRQEINEIHQVLTEGKAEPERRKLLKLADLEAELRDEINPVFTHTVYAKRQSAVVSALFLAIDLFRTVI